MRPAQKFEAALDAARAAWEAEQEASAAKIQALLSEGLQMMRERDQARREASAWRDAYRGATGTDDDTSLSWEADAAIEAGTLLGSVAGR
jgi:hypothetical protein